MNNLLLSVLANPVEQKDFAQLLHVSEARVSQLLAEGVLLRDGTLGEWIVAYTERLRDQASGRGQELTIERAALARSQRIGQDIKNAVAQGDYAPIGLLTDVLAAASAGVSGFFDALSGDLSTRCPHLDEATRTLMLEVIAAARNEWVRRTASLAAVSLDELVEADVDEQLPDALPDASTDEPEDPAP